MMTPLSLSDVGGDGSGYMVGIDGSIYDVDTVGTHEQWCKHHLGMTADDAINRGWIRLTIHGGAQHKLYFVGKANPNQKCILSAIAAIADLIVIDYN